MTQHPRTAPSRQISGAVQPTRVTVKADQVETVSQAQRWDAVKKQAIRSGGRQKPNGWRGGLHAARPFGSAT